MTAPLSLAPRSHRGPILGFIAMVGVPLTLAAAYFYGVAVDRYVTEFRYSVRGGAALQQSDRGPGGAIGSGAALVFASDSFVLKDYLTSSEAFANVEARLPLREMLDRDGDDPVRRFDADAPVEELIGFWRAAVTPRFDAITGVTTVDVTLFAPEDAAQVAQALVAELRRIVDSLSAEARTEMLRYVNDEFNRATADLERTRRAIETFRRANQVISPSEQVTIGADIIGVLSGQLAQRTVELRSLRRQAPNAPRIPSLEREIRSIDEQLKLEISRRGGEDGAALPGQLTSFDELENAYQIARDTYVSTLQLKQAAEANATLGQAELVVFVPPRAATMSTAPDRPLELLKVFAVAFMTWLVLRILLASLSTQ